MTGKIDDKTAFDQTDYRASFPRFTPEARRANQAVVDLVNQVAQQKNASPAQIALAWLIAQKPYIVSIPGTTKRHRLEENLGAASVELTADELAELNQASATIPVEGARLPEDFLQLSYR